MKSLKNLMIVTFFMTSTLCLMIEEVCTEYETFNEKHKDPLKNRSLRQSLRESVNGFLDWNGQQMLVKVYDLIDDKNLQDYADKLHSNRQSFYDCSFQKSQSNQKSVAVYIIQEALIFKVCKNHDTFNQDYINQLSSKSVSQVLEEGTKILQEKDYYETLTVQWDAKLFKAKTRVFFETRELERYAEILIDNKGNFIDCAYEFNPLYIDLNQNQRKAFKIIIIEESPKIINLCKDLNTFNRIYSQKLNSKSLIDVVRRGDKLGEGGNGINYKVMWGNIPVAAKHITSKISHADVLSDEIEIFKNLQGDEHIPKFYDCAYNYSQNNIDIFIIQELLAYDLDNKALKIEMRTDKRKREQFLRDLFLSLKAVHDKRIGHNDIKEPNIMMDFNKKIKLIDFGLSDDFGKYSNYSTQCYDMPRGQNSRSNNNYIMGPGQDIYSMAITAATFLNSWNGVCFEYNKLNCGKTINTNNCLKAIKGSISSVMKQYFSTPIKTEYVLSSCKDVGCIILSCIKFDVDQIPSLDDILEKFESILNPKVIQNIEVEADEEILKPLENNPLEIDQKRYAEKKINKKKIKRNFIEENKMKFAGKNIKI
jgi:serine/threonine protein kinase